MIADGLQRAVKNGDVIYEDRRRCNVDSTGRLISYYECEPHERLLEFFFDLGNKRVRANEKNVQFLKDNGYVRSERSAHFYLWKKQ